MLLLAGHLHLGPRNADQGIPVELSGLFSNLALGFSVALTLQNLGWCLVGAIVGTAIGVLPGVGPVATMALLLPVTYYLPPEGALIMLAGIYYGAQYGGSTTAILVNLPGESSSVVTCLDGYQMARQGRAGAALAIAAIGSFFAGCVATMLIAVAAPPLIAVAQQFGPADYCSLMVLGLVTAVVMAHGSVIRHRHDPGSVARHRRHRREYRQSSPPFIGILFDRINFVPIAMGGSGINESANSPSGTPRPSLASPACCRHARICGPRSPPSCEAPGSVHRCAGRRCRAGLLRLLHGEKKSRGIKPLGRGHRGCRRSDRQQRRR